MQLIFEAEQVNITSNMSTLEDVLDEKSIVNGIIENITNDINIGNKENINNPPNVIKKEPVNQIDNDNIKYSENEATTEACDKIIKTEIEDERNTSVVEENDVQLKLEKQDCEEYQGICIKYEEQTEKGTIKDNSKSNDKDTDDKIALIQQEINTMIKKEITTEQESTNDSCNLNNSSLNIDKNILNNVTQEIEDFSNSTEKANTEENKDKIKKSHNEIIDNEIAQSQQSSKNNTSFQVEIICGESTSKHIEKEEIQEKVMFETESTVLNDKVKDKNENNTLESMDIEIVDEEDEANNKIDKFKSELSQNLIDNIDDSSSSNIAMECVDVTEVIHKETTQKAALCDIKDDVMVVDEEKDVITTELPLKTAHNTQVETELEKNAPRRAPLICRLSNTLNILSDDEDEPDVSENVPPKEPEQEVPKIPEVEKSSINLIDDDDIVVIDEDATNQSKSNSNKEDTCENNTQKSMGDNDIEMGETKSNFMESIELSSVKNSKESLSPDTDTVIKPCDNNKEIDDNNKIRELEKPLIADGFLNSAKKRLADMTREELEDFCVLKIVESIVDRSNLSEIKTKLKTMAQTFEEYNKKTKMLTKQNRDLQVILKSIQEEQKKKPDAITPLKITRSVGMQVLMIEKPGRKKGNVLTTLFNNSKPRNTLNQSPRSQKSPNTSIPVPRLIPANNATATKSPIPQNNAGIVGKQVMGLQNGAKINLPPQKLPEKRPLNKSISSDCVDLTDDEPPTKMIPRNPAPPPVRVVPSQNLLAPQRPQFGQTMNSPRKVYIPISSTQGTNIRPGQTFMVKAGGPRQRIPTPNMTRASQNQMRFSRVAPNAPVRHPAPLPDAMKQYQPPNWKALPPAPTLKLSKVENGIVISWKIEGVSEDSYEDIASYQLYAYQETASPPSTALWKKIGDVKALPLPMACTLTQFMAGFKYYFAVRAVDIRSRLGPFSTPGSILLLNKM